MSVNPPNAHLQTLNSDAHMNAARKCVLQPQSVQTLLTKKRKWKLKHNSALVWAIIIVMSALANTTNDIFTLPYRLTQSALLLSVTLSLGHLSVLTQWACVCVNVTDYSHSHERKLACPYEEQMRKTRTHTSKHTTGSNQNQMDFICMELKEALCLNQSVLFQFCCPTSYKLHTDHFYPKQQLWMIAIFFYQQYSLHGKSEPKRIFFSDGAVQQQRTSFK